LTSDILHGFGGPLQLRIAGSVFVGFRFLRPREGGEAENQ
jgi:hypothetical protein